MPFIPFRIVRPVLIGMIRRLKQTFSALAFESLPETAQAHSVKRPAQPA